MTDKTRNAFELSGAGGVYKSPVDWFDPAVAREKQIWQAATAAERKRLTVAIEGTAADLNDAMRQGKTLGEKHNVMTLGKIEILKYVADAIRRGGDA